jgi:hypothetical protein
MSQNGSLTHGHKKLGIDPISLCAGVVWHAVGKLLTRDRTLLKTSSRLKVCTRSHSPAKLRESNLGNFGTLETKNHLDEGLVERCRVYYMGKVVASAESRPWWVLWVQSRPWLILTPKVLQQCINQLVGWFCVGSCEWIVCLSLFLVPSRSFSTPLYPRKCWKLGSVPWAPNFSIILCWEFKLN